MLVYNEKVKWGSKNGQNELKLLKIKCNKKNLCAFFPKDKIEPRYGDKIYNKEKADPYFNFVSNFFSLSKCSP